MKRLLAMAVALVVALPVPVQAQGNDNDYTPLNSRIRRDRQFPTELRNYIDPARATKATRDRSKAMLNQFSKCLYNRSSQGVLDLLAKTDLGFADFAQIDLETDRAVRIFGFNDCLRRVADSHGTGVQLRFSPGGLRQWLLQEAYYARFPDGATWVKPGASIGERHFPLSGSVGSVRAVADFADCVVATDPYGADFFFRVPAGSEDEKAAINGLAPALGPCLPDGQQVQMPPEALRLWLGEALWHAANNIRPPLAASSEGAQ